MQSVQSVHLTPFDFSGYFLIFKKNGDCKNYNKKETSNLFSPRVTYAKTCKSLEVNSYTPTQQAECWMWHLLDQMLIARNRVLE